MDGITIDPAELMDLTEMREKLARILTIIPKEVILAIMKTAPTSPIKVTKAKETSYARWHVARVVKDLLMTKDWGTIVGDVKDQGRCESCWAVVAAELISALLYLEGKNPEYIDYSALDLVDNADPSKVGTRKDEHFCYLLTIRRGLVYALQNGLQKESDCNYGKCRHPSEVPARASSGLAHIDGVEKLSLTQALTKLEDQPVGASMAIFMPDYLEVKKGVYRGPTQSNSKYAGNHGVSIVGMVEKNREKLFKVRSTHGDTVGDKGYFYVSMEYLVQVRGEGEKIDEKFTKPTMLLTNFVIPTLLKGA